MPTISPTAVAYHSGMLKTQYRAPPPRQRRYIEVVEYCRAMFAKTGSVPSYSMIAEALRLADKGSVRRCVKEAEAAGLITLAEYKGGRGPRGGQRIRLGTPEEAAEGRQTIKMGYEL